ncbi:MAG: TonB-dependent receptor, partial [Bacteroidetes bacterium]|nr:TonB-dependent receptor [Bacteroidota bacterium]
EFSLISQGGGYSFRSYANMQNTGTAENKGIELTLEKFLHKGFYYLFTASIFESGYRGYDGIWRNSAFNNNFVFNALSGYEWRLSQNSLLSVDLKIVYAGGNRYLPIDAEESISEGNTEYDWVRAYEEQFPDYFRLNTRITYRLNMRKVNQEWALDLQNMTNHQNIFTQNWNSAEQRISTSYQMGFMPMVTYRIYF